MRMSSWTPDIVRFMEDAASVTDYFGIMARVGTQGLPSGSVVLDAGCGMGQLACSMAAWINPLMPSPMRAATPTRPGQGA